MFNTRIKDIRTALVSLAVSVLACITCRRYRKPTSDWEQVKRMAQAAEARDLVLDAQYRTNDNRLFHRQLTVVEACRSAFLSINEVGRIDFLEYSKIESIHWNGEVRVGGFTPASNVSHHFDGKAKASPIPQRIPAPLVKAAVRQKDSDSMATAGAALMSLLVR